MKALAPTLALLVIALGLGGYIYFFERGPMAETGKTVLLRTDPGKVSTVILTQKAPAKLTLRRNGEKWSVQQTSPTLIAAGVAVPADPDTVKGLLEALQLVQSSTVVERSAAREKEFGITSASPSLDVDGTLITFGQKPSFEKTSIYARIGDQLTVLPASLADQVHKPYKDWRDHAVLRLKAEDVSHLQIQAKTVAATLEHSKHDEFSDEWTLTAPVKAPGDAVTVGALLNGLAGEKSTAFLDDRGQDLAHWGLDHPVAEVRVTVAGQPHWLQVGKALSGGFAARNDLSPVIFQVAKSALDVINKPIKEWRSKDVMKFDLSQLTHVTVQAEGKTLAYRKDQDKWKAESGTPSSLDDSTNNAVFDLLYGVQALRADDFIDQPRADYGLTRPLLQVTLTGKEWSGSQLVQCAMGGAKTYVRVGPVAKPQESIFVLPGNSLSGLRGNVTKLLHPTSTTPGSASPQTGMTMPGSVKPQPGTGH